jgi:hypothetical protein
MVEVVARLNQKAFGAKSLLHRQSLPAFRVDDPPLALEGAHPMYAIV